MWRSSDSFLHWRNRITGTKLAYLTGSKFASENCDYPDNSKHSSLYTWWMKQDSYISIMKDGVLEDSKEILKLRDKIVRENFTNRDDVNELERQISAFQSVLERASSRVEAANQTQRNIRIAASLKRYENWCKTLGVSEMLRWLIIEWGFSLCIGFYAIYKLTLIVYSL